MQDALREHLDYVEHWRAFSAVTVCKMRSSRLYGFARQRRANAIHIAIHVANDHQPYTCFSFERSLIEIGKSWLRQSLKIADRNYIAAHKLSVIIAAVAGGTLGAIAIRHIVRDAFRSLVANWIGRLWNAYEWLPKNGNGPHPFGWYPFVFEYLLFQSISSVFYCFLQCVFVVRHLKANA